jgi:hypothetical protein
MTFDEFIQDGLGTAEKLFDKLEQTGPNAVKTRERLFVDLKAELSSLSRFERHHMIPALGAQKKTLPLVKALEKDAEKVAELLAELETAPRAGDAFLHKLTELKGAFQAHVRNERKDLLPAVLDALHRAQKAEQAAAETAAAELEAATLKAAELKAAQAEAEAHAKAAIEQPTPVETQAAAVKAGEMKAAATPEPAPAAISEVAPAQDELPRVPLPIPAPLAAIAILQTLAPPLAPPAPIAIAPPLPLPLPTPAFGVQAWANLMQEAAAGAMMGYRLMMAYSNNTDFAALQTRLMKEQVELMTKSGAKMMEAAQRFTKVAG